MCVVDTTASSLSYNSASKSAKPNLGKKHIVPFTPKFLVSMTVKRSRDEPGEIEAIAMANCLMLLSKVGENNIINQPQSLNERLFTCKTCNRQFHSFQALGGHRASHKKPKLMGDVDLHLSDASESHSKPKTHECSICGLEFPIGQALGGHMRRHRPSITGTANESSLLVAPKAVAPPVLKKSNSIKRVWGLDLNLSPLENDLRFQIAKMTPKVDIVM